MSGKTYTWGDFTGNHDSYDPYGARTYTDEWADVLGSSALTATPISHETKPAPEHTPRRRYDPNWQWTDHAACKGHSDVMNPDVTCLRGRGATERKRALYARAVAICNGCDVRTECLAYAMNGREEYGVWGGLTPEQRDARRTGARG